MKVECYINLFVTCLFLSFAYMYTDLKVYCYICIGILVIYFLAILCHITVIPTLKKMVPFMHSLVGDADTSVPKVISNCVLYLFLPMLITPTVQYIIMYMLRR